MKEQTPQYFEGLMNKVEAKTLVIPLVLANLGLLLFDPESGKALIPPTIALSALSLIGEIVLKNLKKNK